MWWKYLIVIFAGYFIGSINFAVIFTRINGKDITKMGSGNPGTMNMVRNMGAKWGALTLVCDATKGAVSGIIGQLLLGDVGMYAGGLSAVIGHIYPVTLGFKGGKGVATTIGVFMVASPVLALITFGVQLVFLLVVKYGSLSSLLFVTVLAVEQGIKYGDSVDNLPVILMIFAIWLLVWLGHRRNIVNAILGKEHRTDIMRAFKKIKTEKKDEI